MIKIESPMKVFKVSEVVDFLNELKNTSESEELFLKEAKNNLPRQIFTNKEFVTNLIEEGFPEIIKISNGKIQRDEEILSLVESMTNNTLEL
jgi:hypothetical protein